MLGLTWCNLLPPKHSITRTTWKRKFQNSKSLLLTAPRHIRDRTVCASAQNALKFFLSPPAICGDMFWKPELSRDFMGQGKDLSRGHREKQWGNYSESNGRQLSTVYYHTRKPFFSLLAVQIGHTTIWNKDNLCLNSCWQETHGSASSSSSTSIWAVINIPLSPPLLSLSPWGIPPSKPKAH